LPRDCRHDPNAKDHAVYPPPSPSLLTHAADPTLNRLRTRMGVVGVVLTTAYLALLPLLAG
jgi:hypothetical protein